MFVFFVCNRILLLRFASRAWRSSGAGIAKRSIAIALALALRSKPCQASEARQTESLEKETKEGKSPVYCNILHQNRSASANNEKTRKENRIKEKNGGTTLQKQKKKEAV